MTEKEDTRKQVIRQRDALPIDARLQKSQQICDQLLRESLQQLETISANDTPIIAAYEPMRSEVDVHPFLTAAFERGWHVCLPCMVKDSENAAAHMVFFELAQAQVFEERPAFLDHPARPFLLADLQAQGWREVDEGAFDIAVIPMVAFDNSLMRLGYGGGNYDRFLPKLRPDCFIAGVAFEEQRVDTVPTEPHDLPLPRIISA